MRVFEDVSRAIFVSDFFLHNQLVAPFIPMEPIFQLLDQD